MLVPGQAEQPVWGKDTWVKLSTVAICPSCLKRIILKKKAGAHLPLLKEKRCSHIFPLRFSGSVTSNLELLHSLCRASLASVRCFWCSWMLFLLHPWQEGDADPVLAGGTLCKKENAAEESCEGRGLSGDGRRGYK